MLWPILWAIFMLALIVATTVAGLREKKARDQARKAMQPQPMGDAELDPGLPPGEDGFGSDGFGDDGFGDAADPLAAGAGEVADLDENAFT